MPLERTFKKESNKRIVYVSYLRKGKCIVLKLSSRNGISCLNHFLSSFISYYGMIFQNLKPPPHVTLTMTAIFSAVVLKFLK